ncbi:hypothetical protein KCU65_g9158, partial [Aureobasidium melanogenum]
MSFNFGSNTSSGSTPSLFGTAANKDATSTGGLFGNANKAPASTGSIFGNATSSTGQTTSAFGAASPSSQTPTTSGFSFGAKPPASGSNPTTPGVAPANNPFGGAAASTGGGLSFGNNSTTPATTNKPLFSTTPAGPPPTQSTGGIFGGGKPLSFGKPEEKAAEAPKSAPAFGAPLGGASNAFGSFGKKADDNSATPSLFGQKPAEGAAPANKPMFNLGGASSSTPQSAPATTPAFSLGGNSSKPAFSLGGNTSQTPASTQPASATTPAPSLFGGLRGGGPATSAETPATTATSTSGLFGAKKDDATDKPAAPTGNLFGGLNQNKDTADKPASSPSLFGATGQNKDEAAKPPASTGNLFGGLGGAKKDDAAKPATPTGNLFGNLGGQKKDDAAATPASTTATSGSTPAFSLGAKPTESSTPASTGGSAFSLKPAAGGSGGSGGNGGAPPAVAATPAAGPNNGAGSNSTGGIGSSTTNASTSGPAPPATSRLNSKSLDEIITLWTTSLSSHQKQFSNLATKIGSWDRMLVENSDKISKLYSRTFQAERDTAEVERQLASVEGQQEELSHWLDHYERVLNDMAAKAGGVDSGVDAERERTYQTAERCSARLTTMSHDLTSMIDEINLASTNLSKSSKTAESDPLSQIVRVLNAHLGQLQQIDVGAEQLRQKVESAQKEVRGFGGRGASDEGVEGFMRSLRR